MKGLISKQTAEILTCVVIWLFVIFVVLRGVPW